MNLTFLLFGRPDLRNLIVFISSASYLVELFLFVPNCSYIGTAFALSGYAIINALLAVIFLKDSIRREKVGLLKARVFVPDV